MIIDTTNIKISESKKIFSRVSSIRVIESFDKGEFLDNFFAKIIVYPGKNSNLIGVIYNKDDIENAPETKDWLHGRCVEGLPRRQRWYDVRGVFEVKFKNEKSRIVKR